MKKKRLISLLFSSLILCLGVGSNLTRKAVSTEAAPSEPFCSVGIFLIDKDKTYYPGDIISPLDIYLEINDVLSSDQTYFVYFDENGNYKKDVRDGLYQYNDPNEIYTFKFTFINLDDDGTFLTRALVAGDNMFRWRVSSEHNGAAGAWVTFRAKTTEAPKNDIVFKGSGTINENEIGKEIDDSIFVTGSNLIDLSSSYTSYSSLESDKIFQAAEPATGLAFGGHASLHLEMSTLGKGKFNRISFSFMTTCNAPCIYSSTFTFSDGTNVEDVFTNSDYSIGKEVHKREVALYGKQLISIDMSCELEVGSSRYFLLGFSFYGETNTGTHSEATHSYVFNYNQWFGYESSPGWFIQGGENVIDRRGGSVNDRGGVANNSSSQCINLDTDDDKKFLRFYLNENGQINIHKVVVNAKGPSNFELKLNLTSANGKPEFSYTFPQLTNEFEDYEVIIPRDYIINTIGLSFSEKSGHPIGYARYIDVYETTASDFASYLVNDIHEDGICDPNGVNSDTNAIKTLWMNAATSFNLLAEKEKLTVYYYMNHDCTDANINNFFEAYDYLLSKYGETLELTNFLNRAVNQSRYINRIVVKENKQTVCIAVVVAIISIASLCLLVFRKRAN